MNRTHVFLTVISTVLLIGIGLLLNQDRGQGQRRRLTTVTAETLASKVKQVSKDIAAKTSPRLVASSLLQPLEPASDQTLDEIYDSLNLDAKLSHDLNARLQIAHERGASSEEMEFRLLASILADLETRKDSSSQNLAFGLASMLREMRGQDIFSVAAEMAYEAFPMLAEAAVDAAVAADLATNPENQVGSAPTTSLMTQGNDAEAQALFDAEVKKKPAE